MHKHNSLVPWKDYVRLTWQIIPMQPKSEAESMKERPDGNLRFRIAGADSPHVPASVLWAQLIHFRKSATDSCSVRM